MAYSNTGHNPFDAGDDDYDHYSGQQGTYVPPALDQPAARSSFGPGRFEPLPFETADLPPMKITSGSSAFPANDDELRRRERELEQREAALRKKQSSNASAPAAAGSRPKNWPRCKPCLHHDINEEIPEAAQWFVRKTYQLWFVNMFLLFFNMISDLALLIQEVDTGASFGLAIAYFVLGIPLTFWGWYLPIYNACRLDKSRYFVVFFCTFGTHIAAVIFFTLGIVNTGSAGFIVAAEGFSASKPGSATMGIINGCLFVFNLAFSIFLFKKAHGYFRGRGHSLEKAGAEGAVAAAKSKTGQKVAKEAGKEIFANAMAER